MALAFNCCTGLRQVEVVRSETGGGYGQQAGTEKRYRIKTGHRQLLGVKMGEKLPK
jgi:hypothetical protein